MLLHKYMKIEDLEFLVEKLDNLSWLFYGELDKMLPNYLKLIFYKELKDWGFNEDQTIKEYGEQFWCIYWLILSELVRNNLAEYGTSPRGACLTEDGERFKRIILENPDWLEQKNKYYQ